MFKKISALAFFFSLLCCLASAYGKDILLFDDQNQPLSNYDERITQIQAGDQVVFFNHRNFKIKSVLGGGENSLVFEALNNEGQIVALKLSAKKNYRNVLNKMFQVYKEEFAKHSDFPVVPIYEFEPSQYLVLKLLKPILSVNDFLTELKKSKDAENYKPWNELKNFARQTAQYRLIGDMRWDQVVYTSEGWVIQDWLDGSLLADKTTDPHIFSISHKDSIPILESLEHGAVFFREESLYLPRKYTKEITEIIRAERKKQNLPTPETLFEKCARFLSKIEPFRF